LKADVLTAIDWKKNAVSGYNPLPPLCVEVQFDGWKLGFEMAKPAKSDQLGTGTQRLCRKPPWHARLWPERKSAPSHSWGATLTANASESTQPDSKGQVVNEQGSRPSSAEKVARHRLSNPPNKYGLEPRDTNAAEQILVGKWILFQSRTKGRQPTCNKFLS
jgi:hypothetical protein